jgi:hypothetical protein
VSIVAADLVAYNSASMPDDDTDTCGGAIDTLRRPDFTQMSTSNTVRAVSANAGDTTQTITLIGRLADGTIVSEVLNLNGTTPVTTSATYERLLSAELSATCAGAVTVARTTGPTTIRVIPVGERGFTAIFQQCSSDPSVQKIFYGKFFWKNTHGSLALTSSVVKQSADPDSRITHALDASLDASTSTTDRTTSPGFTFNDSDKNVPNSQSLSAGSAIGTWLKLTLPAADSSHRTTYTSELDGQTV